MKEKRSPRITRLSWDHMEVAGLGGGKDFKLYPGGGREWDWRETDTQHVPGIQPADLEELIRDSRTRSGESRVFLGEVECLL